MKIFECKCGSKDIFIKDSGNNKGLYCADCGKWMQWLGKDDLKLAERQIEQSIVNPIPRNIDELKNHDAKVRAEVIEEVYDRIDEGVCLMCEHRHEDYKCINDCNKNGWERETIMKWLKEQKNE